jgi:hypothetical protein
MVVDFAFYPMHFLKMSKRPNNASLIQCIGASYTRTCFGILERHHQGVRYEHAEMMPNVVESREGWELYIVTDGVMVGLYPYLHAACYSIQLPSFSASHDIGHNLSMLISDYLMMAF